MNLSQWLIACLLSTYHGVTPVEQSVLSVLNGFLNLGWNSLLDKNIDPWPRKVGNKLLNIFHMLVYPVMMMMVAATQTYSYQSYQGHYVLLVGFDPKSKEILYRNPTLKDKVCYMSYDCLEESRTSYGTDEDVIFICPS